MTQRWTHPRISAELMKHSGASSWVQMLATAITIVDDYEDVIQQQAAEIERLQDENAAWLLTVTTDTQTIEQQAAELQAAQQRVAELEAQLAGVAASSAERSRSTEQQATADDDIELDSPNWHSDDLAALEARGFRRINDPRQPVTEQQAAWEPVQDGFEYVDTSVAWTPKLIAGRDHIAVLDKDDDGEYIALPATIRLCRLVQRPATEASPATPGADINT